MAKYWVLSPGIIPPKWSIFQWAFIGIYLYKINHYHYHYLYVVCVAGII